MSVKNIETKLRSKNVMAQFNMVESHVLSVPVDCPLSELEQRTSERK